MRNYTLFSDVLYGDFEIDGVINELIQSTPFQRLKGIHQGGALFLVDPTQQQTRFEHSIGVYWLVNHFEGNLEERVAALLHDVSHTAFSHVGDYVFDHSDEDYHESIFQEIINHPEIQIILSNHHLSHVFDSFDSYTLLERSLPDICADRIDYTLRDLYHSGRISREEINEFIADIKVEKGKLILSTPESASWFSLKYAELNESYFRRPEYLYANHRFTELLKNAIADGKLKTEDLMNTDQEVISKLELSGFKDELLKISQLEDFDKFQIEKAAAKIKKREVSL